MPVYEYEPMDHDCLMCEGRIEVIQGVNEEALKYCPHCGMDVKRIVSRARFKVAGDLPQMDKAGQKGFTKYKRAEKGVWERVDGVGPDVIAGSKEDIAAVEAEKKPKKIVELDG